MNIARVSKKEDLNRNFQHLARSGLVNYSALRYKKWYWQYIENPFCLEEDMPLWICTLDGKAAGQLGTIPVELKVNSGKISAAWAVDFLTLQECRRKGVGRALVDEANKHYGVFLTIGQTDMSFGLFMKMGWNYLGCIPYYILIWDLKALIREKIRNRFVVNLVCMPAAVFLKIFNYFKRPKKPREIEICKIDNFNQEADCFWEEIVGFYKIAVPRNKAYLNWKYDRQPGMDYVKFRAARGNKVCGYIVVRSIKSEWGKPEGLIADIITRPDDKNAVHALLFAALEYFRNENCSIVRCYMNRKEIQKVLINCGFIKRKPQMRFLANKNVDGLDEMYNLDDWYITAGDCDIDR